MSSILSLLLECINLLQADGYRGSSENHNRCEESRVLILYIITHTLTKINKAVAGLWEKSFHEFFLTSLLHFLSPNWLHLCHSPEKEKEIMIIECPYFKKSFYFFIFIFNKKEKNILSHTLTFLKWLSIAYSLPLSHLQCWDGHLWQQHYQHIWQRWLFGCLAAGERSPNDCSSLD